MPELNAYAEVCLERILPTFDGIEKEAEDLAERAFEELGQQLGGDDMVDLGDLAEDARDHGLDRYMTLSSLSQAVTNLCIVGLYHLFEQQILHLLPRLGITPTAETNPVPELEAYLEFVGITTEHPSRRTKLRELQLAANTVKHGPGRSSIELQELRPDLFEGDPALPFERPPYRLRPLQGEGFYLERKDLEVYLAALRAFWSDLDEELSL